MNSFTEILEYANQHDWCVKPYCTTCGAHEYRDSLHELSLETNNGLVVSLSMTDVSCLLKYSNWDDAVRIALMEIKSAENMDCVLKSWMSSIHKNIKLADIVLFYHVRRGAVFAPMSVEVHKDWTGKCVELAIRTKDESLLESLIYTLQKDVKEFEGLQLAIDAAIIGSRKIQLALQRTL
jgi:hypothetical protein